jgi:ferric-dicitrate binding protein FerR (iron transport regulator)
MKKPNDHIESLITRKISGEISIEEETILNKWLSASDENASYFQDLKKIFAEASSEEQKLPKIDVDREWQQFKNIVHSNKRSYRTPAWLRIAASIVIIATLGYLLWNNSFQSKELTIIAQTSGQVLILPDQSIITLNKGAELTYPRKFSAKNRSVELVGEGFFEVTRDESKPFIVNLGLTNVEVLGTSFNIDAEEDNENIEVVVNTGKVRFTSTSTNESVILVRGEKGMLMKNSNLLSKIQNNDVNFMAWKTRKIVFNDVELDDVIQTLNKLYETQITFATEVGQNCKVTVSFDNQSIEAILSVLEATLNLEYKKTGDIIEVVKTGC